MSEKDLKINFRYLTGNIACMSVDSVNGEPVHNDIDNEEAIILFNSLVGEKEGCRTLKTLLKEIQKLKGVIETYEIIIKSTNVLNWHELKKFIDERIKSVQEEKEEFEEDLYNNYETNCAEIIIRRCELTQLEDIREQMQELENKQCHTTSE